MTAMIYMQVDSYGVISFGVSYHDYPRHIPLSTNDTLIIPFWDFLYGGLVLFRISNDQTLLNEVGSIINEFEFTPTMLFIATWSMIHDTFENFEVCMYGVIIIS